MDREGTFLTDISNQDSDVSKDISSQSSETRKKPYSKSKYKFKRPEQICRDHKITFGKFG